MTIFSLEVEREKTVAWVFTSPIWRRQSFVHCSTLFTASGVLYAEGVVYSYPLHTARSSACRVLEICRESTVVILLMYRKRVSVKWLLPVGLLLALSRFCSNGHPVLFWLICPVGSIGSICTFFQKRRSLVCSAGDLHARLYQKLLLGQRKQKQPFLFLKDILYHLGNEGQLIFCASVFPIYSLCWWP